MVVSILQWLLVRQLISEKTGSAARLKFLAKKTLWVQSFSRKSQINVVARAEQLRDKYEIDVNSLQYHAKEVRMP